jgi:exosortase
MVNAQSTTLGSRSPFAVSVAVGVGLVAVLYWDLFLWWREAWSQEGYYCTHGPLIPLVSAYLVWSRVTDRRRGAEEADRGGNRDWLPGLMIVVAACLLQLLSIRLNVRLASGVSLVALCFGAIWLLWGRRWAMDLAFPVAFLVFMIPVPFVANALTTPLQMRAASVAAMVGGTLGMPVGREGLVLHLPNYQFEVAPTCSGVNSLFSLVPLAVLLASFQAGTWWARGALVLAAAPLALIANSVRIVTTLVLATWFGPEAADGFFHTASGLVVFGVALVGLLAVGRVLMQGNHPGAREPAVT